MLDRETAAFLMKHEALLADENFTLLYDQALKFGEVDIPALTEAFLSADIDPLQHLYRVPLHYATGLPLKSVDIPEGISHIGACAFQDCKDLTSVHLPSSLEAIGYWAFASSKLTEVHVPDSTASIGRGAFEGCGKLKSIGLSNSLAAVEPRTFCRCGSLKSIIFGDQLRDIGTDAFLDCHSLPSLTFPASLLSIQLGAFRGCSSLEELTFLGAKSPQIEINAFANCPIKLIHFKGSTASWRQRVEVEAFSSHNDVEVLCADGKLIKRRSEFLEWKLQE